MDRSPLRLRWLAGHLVVLALVVAMANLGFWQLGRLDERRAVNAEVLRGSRTITALDAVVAPRDAEVGSARYRRIEVRGAFDAQHELLVRFRTSDGLPGFEVVTPLVTAPGIAVLVDRGWVPLTLGERWPVPRSGPPPGTVRVIGLLHEAEDGEHFRPSPVGSTPLVVGAIATDRLEERLPYDFYPGWVQLESPDEVGVFPSPLPPPDLGEGPHLSYALQWFAFSLIALVGWVLLVRSGSGRRNRPPVVDSSSQNCYDAASRA